LGKKRKEMQGPSRSSPKREPLSDSFKLSGGENKQEVRILHQGRKNGKKKKGGDFFSKQLEAPVRGKERGEGKKGWWYSGRGGGGRGKGKGRKTGGDGFSHWEKRGGSKRWILSHGEGRAQGRKLGRGKGIKKANKKRKKRKKKGGNLCPLVSLKEKKKWKRIAGLAEPKMRKG